VTTTVPAEAVDSAKLPAVITVDTQFDTRRRDRRFVWFVAAAVLVGCALRIGIGLTDDAPTSDETAYLSSGITLIEGDGFAREGRPELHFPPFVPFLFGAASLVFSDPHDGAVWLTIVAGTALLVPVALLARRVAGATAGIAAAWIAALAPGLATVPALRGAGTEAEYTLLLVWSLWLVISAADHRGRARLLRLAGAGLLVGFAYLTRPEGLFAAAPFALAIVYMVRRDSDRSEPRSWLRPLLTTGAAFGLPLALCVAPYVMFLHDHTGQWQLTAKTQDVSIEAWHAVAKGDRHTRDQVLYALDDTGLEFADDRASLPSLAKDDPSGYVGIFATNVFELVQTIGGVSLLPLPVWALAVYGAWRLRRSRPVLLVLAVCSLPIATGLMFFVQIRYLVPVTAFALILAGIGVAALPPRFRRGTLVGLVALLAIFSLIDFRGNRAGWWHPTEHTDQRAAGEWIADNTDPGDVVMTRSMIVAYYTDRPNLALPYAELPQVVTFARHYGAQYLVADSGSIERMRPQLRSLLEVDQLEGLRLVHEARAEGRVSRVFALDPAPPPSTEVGPSLGFMGDGGA
jgi:4-amino-4-deoxy-L-arabinose transferase-like glycosyltransferase